MPYHVVVDIDDTADARDTWCLHAVDSNQLFLPVGANKPQDPVPTPATVQRHLDAFPSCGASDYRHSRIEVMALDIDPQHPQQSSLEPLKGKFLGSGVIRLFKEWEFEDIERLRTDGSFSDKITESAGGETGAAGRSDASAVDDSTDDNTTVAIVAVPSYFTVPDLLGYVGADTVAGIKHIRIIRLFTPNRYMVLMRFNDPGAAAVFVDGFNGKPFNLMEPETCHAVYIQLIVLNRVDRRALINEAAASAVALLAADAQPGPIVTRKRAPTLSELLKKSLPPPTPVLRELPTCPVCLERMDFNVTGLITIPCQHTFHCQCLTKWKDDSCPVCRYLNIKSNWLQQQQKGPVGNEQCSVPGCGVTDRLWICLVCGHVACGRYDSAHAVLHYEETAHCFAMDMHLQRVWDYVGDNYVHRLLTNQSDGKLVELGPSRSDKGQPRLREAESGEGEDKDYMEHEAEYSKIEAIGLEYLLLLSSQLELQREYYEDKIAQLADINHGLQQRVERYELETKAMRQDLEELAKAMEELRGSKLPLMTDQLLLALADKRRLAKESHLYETELEEERTLGQRLLETVERLTALNAQLAAEKLELEEQVKDLMFFLELREKFKDALDEVKEGTVVVTQPKPKPRRKKR